MSATSTMTLAQLRLEWLSLAMLSLADRLVKSDKLREILEYCVPRRLLRTFCVCAKSGADTMMRLRVEIDYDEHERQIQFSGKGLAEGIAGKYAIKDATDGSQSSLLAQRSGCRRVDQAVDEFVRLARDQGLHLDWEVSFLDRSDELWRKFGYVIPQDFTVNRPTTRVAHEKLPELSVCETLSPESASKREERNQELKRSPEVVARETAHK